MILYKTNLPTYLMPVNYLLLPWFLKCASMSNLEFVLYAEFYCAFSKFVIIINNYLQTKAKRVANTKNENGIIFSIAI